MSTPRPDRFLVFGAAGHIGGPAATWVRHRHPDAQLRLVTSRPAQVDELSARHPDAEVIVADYLDPADMETAFDGIQAAFVVTPDFLDETTAMSNVARAAEASGSLVRLVRLIGDPPGLREESEIADAIAGFDTGTAVQHLRARKVLSSSTAPVVYMNVAAWFMEDFATFLLPPVVERRAFVMPHDRLMNYIDTRDIGRAAAELMLAPDLTEVGETYHLHNGVDMYPFSQVAEVMSKAFGVPIAYDGSEESFLRDLGPSFRSYMGRDDAAEYFLEYCKFELAHVRRLGSDLLNGEQDITPASLGFDSRTFHDWLVDHRGTFVEQPLREGAAAAH